MIWATFSAGSCFYWLYRASPSSVANNIINLISVLTIDLHVAVFKSESVSHSVISDSLWPHELYPTRLLCPWNSPGKSTGLGLLALLHRIFPSQGLNLGLLHCRQILYHLRHQGRRGVSQGAYSHSPQIDAEIWIVLCLSHVLVCYNAFGAFK